MRFAAATVTRVRLGAGSGERRLARRIDCLVASRLDGRAALVVLEVDSIRIVV